MRSSEIRRVLTRERPAAVAAAASTAEAAYDSSAPVHPNHKMNKERTKQTNEWIERQADGSAECCIALRRGAALMLRCVRSRRLTLVLGDDGRLLLLQAHTNTQAGRRRTAHDNSEPVRVCVGDWTQSTKMLLSHRRAAGRDSSRRFRCDLCGVRE